MRRLVSIEWKDLPSQGGRWFRKRTTRLSWGASYAHRSDLKYGYRFGFRQAGSGFFVYLDAGGAIGSPFARIMNFQLRSTLTRQPLDALIRADHLCLIRISESHFPVFGSLERQDFSSSIHADQLSF